MVNTLTNEEVDKLLNLFQIPPFERVRGSKAVRNYALVLFMLDAGLRVGEVVQLRVSDLFYAGEPVKLLTVRSEIAKRHTEREIPMSPRLQLTVKLLKVKVWYLRPFVRDHFAFYLKDSDEHIGRRQVERIVADAGMAALGRHITPHTLRHTFGTRVLRKSNIRIAQQLLGHKSITSTQIYTHPNSDERKAAIDAISTET